ncbi:nucleotidyl transferase AbiEii/AbiGii toxin family protein [Kribbella sp. NPDC051620]|uniref:nucleotidyl transferase AbiEii/AbiGii toxin family protein n=1 Tax=Kribbella sp. NPDC051620 TaxID=3364120 RepID=UPI0037873EEC
MRDVLYRNPVGFRAGVEARIRAEAAAASHRTVDQVRRQFLLQRFLVRVFAGPDGPWVLKGGTGLIVRIPGARHSDDIDLLYSEQEALLENAVADLRRLADRAPEGDFLRFEIAEPVIGSGQDVGHVVAQLKVSSYLGTVEYGRFPLDLSLNQRTAEAVDLIQPRPVIELPGDKPLPKFVLYPLAEQVADKVCAMYGKYGINGDRPSTRYRDLVDLTIIITTQELDASRTVRALRDEAKRRILVLPMRLSVPGTDWEVGYGRVAGGTLLPIELRAVDPALNAVSGCLQPLLDGTVAEGTWNPLQMSWN